MFDPFEFKLCRLESSNGNPIEEQACSFLPIQLFEKNGHALENIQFQVQSSDNAIIVLLGIVENKNIVLASCDFFDASPVKNIEGYQPELIKGCSQPENGNVVTFTFEGEFSQNIAQNNGMLFIDSPVLTKKMASKAAAASSEKQTIKIDGQFDEWRNIKGISDPQGDYVSYLYPNPDTDILEFKVTNDDQYMYFYSRVAGAHGRTGDTGRYYWYTYIDVDGNPYTGYPPTRDDNCYFGVAIGDDCEAQFEFVGNKFIKTFFGFTVWARKKKLWQVKSNWDLLFTRQRIHREPPGIDTRWNMCTIKGREKSPMTILKEQVKISSSPYLLTGLKSRCGWNSKVFCGMNPASKSCIPAEL